MTEILAFLFLAPLGIVGMLALANHKPRRTP